MYYFGFLDDWLSQIWRLYSMIYVKMTVCDYSPSYWLCFPPLPWQKIHFKNSYTARKSFVVATSRSDLLQFKETMFEVRNCFVSFRYGEHKHLYVQVRSWLTCANNYMYFSDLVVTWHGQLS